MDVVNIIVSGAAGGGARGSARAQPRVGGAGTVARRHWSEEHATSALSDSLSVSTVQYQYTAKHPNSSSCSQTTRSCVASVWNSAYRSYLVGWLGRCVWSGARCTRLGQPPPPPCIPCWCTRPLQPRRVFVSIPGGRARPLPPARCKPSSWTFTTRPSWTSRTSCGRWSSSTSTTSTRCKLFCSPPQWRPLPVTP